jgi:helicase
MDTWLTELLALQGIKKLTSVQRDALSAGIANGQSMVVCAPTSSGKTLIGEIAAIAGTRVGCTALYLVSHKALADQKFDEFTRKYGNKSERPIARVGVSTGDRDDGDADPQILIATYEKALSLVMSNAISVGNTVVVADELQLIGVEKRGPDVEILCAALRRKKPKQFVALTATVENGDDLSGWLECKLVQSNVRDVDLLQEIWADDQVYTVRFGLDEGNISKHKGRLPSTTLEAVDLLLQQNRGPIIVFTETRRDAMDLAQSFSSNRSKTPSGFNFSNLLTLFSEATEFTDRLRSTAETKVIFHTADLTPSERLVVEQGLVTCDFDVCFATPTLAAGVNFPFQTVVFDRLLRRYIQPKKLPLGDYRNMSGRAGRLGMHDKGYAILIPRDQDELAYANALVLPENETLVSRLAVMSVRRIVLVLISSKSADSRESLRAFFEQTLFWYQVRDRNPTRLDELVIKVNDAIGWLVEHQMLNMTGEVVAATEFGVAVSKTGLLPSTAYQFAELLKQEWQNLEKQFEEYELPLIHAAVCSDEFNPDIGQRFLPPVDRSVGYAETRNTLYAAPLFFNMNDCEPVENQSAFAVFLFISGEAERKIGARSGIPSGQVHRFSNEIAWVLDGFHRIAGVSTIGCSQRVMNQVGVLARRVRLGVPTEVVDLIRTAHAARVPGFGRQSALTLLRAKLGDRDAVLGADRAQLEKLLKVKERVDKLIEAIQHESPNQFEKSKRLHLRIAELLGIGSQVKDAYDLMGVDYERPIQDLLSMDPELKVTLLDDGKRQGVPDMMIEYKNRAAVIECKTTTKRPPTISKDEAFSVLVKATDIKDVHRITIGKPGFDTFAESKACGSSEITLINHSTFIEAILLRRKGLISLDALFNWFLEPGVAESDRLGVLLAL